MRAKNGEKAARRSRAQALRKDVTPLTTPEPHEAGPGGPEQRPGESDNAYVQRRMRELGRKPRP